ncbi:UTP--glucose-1-phosphate uridylyltransferase [Elusimicrobiota bacterium]
MDEGQKIFANILLEKILNKIAELKGFKKDDYIVDRKVLNSQINIVLVKSFYSIAKNDDEVTELIAMVGGIAYISKFKSTTDKGAEIIDGKKRLSDGKEEYQGKIQGLAAKTDKSEDIMNKILEKFEHFIAFHEFLGLVIDELYPEDKERPDYKTELRKLKTSNRMSVTNYAAAFIKYVKNLKISENETEEMQAIINEFLESDIYKTPESKITIVAKLLYGRYKKVPDGLEVSPVVKDYVKSAADDRTLILPSTKKIAQFLVSLVYKLFGRETDTDTFRKISKIVAFIIAPFWETVTLQIFHIFGKKSFLKRHRLVDTIDEQWVKDKNWIRFGLIMTYTFGILSLIYLPLILLLNIYVGLVFGHFVFNVISKILGRKPMIGGDVLSGSMLYAQNIIKETIEKTLSDGTIAKFADRISEAEKRMKRTYYEDALKVVYAIYFATNPENFNNLLEIYNEEKNTDKKELVANMAKGYFRAYQMNYQEWKRIEDFEKYTELNETDFVVQLVYALKAADSEDKDLVFELATKLIEYYNEIKDSAELADRAQAIAKALKEVFGSDVFKFTFKDSLKSGELMYELKGIVDGLEVADELPKKDEEEKKKEEEKKEEKEKEKSLLESIQESLAKLPDLVRKIVREEFPDRETPPVKETPVKAEPVRKLASKLDGIEKELAKIFDNTEDMDTAAENFGLMIEKAIENDLERDAAYESAIKIALNSSNTTEIRKYVIGAIAKYYMGIDIETENLWRDRGYIISSIGSYLLSNSAVREDISNVIDDVEADGFKNDFLFVMYAGVRKLTGEERGDQIDVMDNVKKAREQLSPLIKVDLGTSYRPSDDAIKTILERATGATAEIMPYDPDFQMMFSRIFRHLGARFYALTRPKKGTEKECKEELARLGDTFAKFAVKRYAEALGVEDYNDKLAILKVIAYVFSLIDTESAKVKFLQDINTNPNIRSDILAKKDPMFKEIQDELGKTEEDDSDGEDTLASFVSTFVTKATSQAVAKTAFVEYFMAVYNNSTLLDLEFNTPVARKEFFVKLVNEALTKIPDNAQKQEKINGVKEALAELLNTKKPGQTTFYIVPRKEKSSIEAALPAIVRGEAGEIKLTLVGMKTYTGTTPEGLKKAAVFYIGKKPAQRTTFIKNVVNNTVVDLKGAFLKYVGADGDIKAVKKAIKEMEKVTEEKITSLKSLAVGDTLDDFIPEVSYKKDEIYSEIKNYIAKEMKILEKLYGDEADVANKEKIAELAMKHASINVYNMDQEDWLKYKDSHWPGFIAELLKLYKGKKTSDNVKAAIIEIFALINKTMNYDPVDFPYPGLDDFIDAINVIKPAVKGTSDHQKELKGALTLKGTFAKYGDDHNLPLNWWKIEKLDGTGTLEYATEKRLVQLKVAPKAEYKNIIHEPFAFFRGHEKKSWGLRAGIAFVWASMIASVIAVPFLALLFSIYTFGIENLITHIVVFVAVSTTWSAITLKAKLAKKSNIFAHTIWNYLFGEKVPMVLGGAEEQKIIEMMKSDGRTTMIVTGDFLENWEIVLAFLNSGKMNVTALKGPPGVYAEFYFDGHPKAVGVSISALEDLGIKVPTSGIIDIGDEKRNKLTMNFEKIFVSSINDGKVLSKAVELALKNTIKEAGGNTLLVIEIAKAYADSLETKYGKRKESIEAAIKEEDLAGISNIEKLRAIIKQLKPGMESDIGRAVSVFEKGKFATLGKENKKAQIGGVRGDVYANTHIMDLEVKGLDGKTYIVTTYRNSPVIVEGCEILGVGPKTKEVWQKIVDASGSVITLGKAPDWLNILGKDVVSVDTAKLNDKQKMKLVETLSVLAPVAYVSDVGKIAKDEFIKAVKEKFGEQATVEIVNPGDPGYTSDLVDVIAGNVISLSKGFYSTMYSYAPPEIIEVVVELLSKYVRKRFIEKTFTESFTKFAEHKNNIREYGKYVNWVVTSINQPTKELFSKKIMEGKFSLKDHNRIHKGDFVKRIPGSIFTDEISVEGVKKGSVDLSQEGKIFEPPELDKYRKLGSKVKAAFVISAGGLSTRTGGLFKADYIFPEGLGFISGKSFMDIKILQARKAKADQIADGLDVDMPFLILASRQSMDAVIGSLFNLDMQGAEGQRELKKLIEEIQINGFYEYNLDGLTIKIFMQDLQSRLIMGDEEFEEYLGKHTNSKRVAGGGKYIKMHKMKAGDPLVVEGEYINNPPGHWDLIRYLSLSGLLGTLKQSGINIIFHSNLNNPSAQLNNLLKGAFQAKIDEARDKDEPEPVAMFLVGASKGEKGGLVARVQYGDGTSAEEVIQLVEGSQLTEEVEKMTKKLGAKEFAEIFPYFNTASMLFNVDGLLKMFKLPDHYVDSLSRTEIEKRVNSITRKIPVTVSIKDTKRFLALTKQEAKDMFGEQLAKVLVVPGGIAETGKDLYEILIPAYQLERFYGDVTGIGKDKTDIAKDVKSIAPCIFAYIDRDIHFVPIKTIDQVSTKAINETLQSMKRTNLYPEILGKFIKEKGKPKGILPEPEIAPEVLPEPEIVPEYKIEDEFTSEEIKRLEEIKIEIVKEGIPIEVTLKEAYERAKEGLVSTKDIHNVLAKVVSVLFADSGIVEGVKGQVNLRVWGEDNPGSYEESIYFNSTGMQVVDIVPGKKEDSKKGISCFNMRMKHPITGFPTDAEVRIKRKYLEAGGAKSVKMFIYAEDEITYGLAVSELIKRISGDFKEQKMLKGFELKNITKWSIQNCIIEFFGNKAVGAMRQCHKLREPGKLLTRANLIYHAIPVAGAIPVADSVDLNGIKLSDHTLVDHSADQSVLEKLEKYNVDVIEDFKGDYTKKVRWFITNIYLPYIARIDAKSTEQQKNFAIKLFIGSLMRNEKDPGIGQWTDVISYVINYMSSILGTPLIFDGMLDANHAYNYSYLNLKPIAKALGVKFNGEAKKDLVFGKAKIEEIQEAVLRNCGRILNNLQSANPTEYDEFNNYKKSNGDRLKESHTADNVAKGVDFDVYCMSQWLSEMQIRSVKEQLKGTRMLAVVHTSSVDKALNETIDRLSKLGFNGYNIVFEDGANISADELSKLNTIIKSKNISSTFLINAENNKGYDSLEKAFEEVISKPAINRFDGTLVRIYEDGKMHIGDVMHSLQISAAKKEQLKHAENTDMQVVVSVGGFGERLLATGDPDNELLGPKGFMSLFADLIHRSAVDAERAGLETGLQFPVEYKNTLQTANVETRLNFNAISGIFGFVGKEELTNEEKYFITTINPEDINITQANFSINYMKFSGQLDEYILGNTDNIDLFESAYKILENTPGLHRNEWIGGWHYIKELERRKLKADENIQKSYYDVKLLGFLQGIFGNLISQFSQKTMKDNNLGKFLGPYNEVNTVLIALCIGNKISMEERFKVNKADIIPELPEDLMPKDLKPILKAQNIDELNKNAKNYREILTNFKPKDTEEKIIHVEAWIKVLGYEGKSLPDIKEEKFVLELMNPIFATALAEKTIPQIMTIKNDEDGTNTSRRWALLKIIEFFDLFADREGEFEKIIRQTTEKKNFEGLRNMLGAA